MVSNPDDASTATTNVVKGPTDFSELQKDQKLLQKEEGQPNEESVDTTPKTTAVLQDPNVSKTADAPTLKRRQTLDRDDIRSDVPPAKRARSSSSKKDILTLLESTEKVIKNGGCTPLADRFNDGLSNCSSTVDDMRRIMVGNNQIYPLTAEMEQRMILQFLQSICEFTDHLSVLSENSALNIVMKYLDVNAYNDIRILFEALYCLGTMLIHLRLAWDFVNMGGLSKLIAVNRYSVAGRLRLSEAIYLPITRFSEGVVCLGFTR